MKFALIGTAHEGVGGGTVVNKSLLFALKEIKEHSIDYYPIISGKIKNLEKFKKRKYDVIFLTTLGYIFDRQYVGKKIPEYIDELKAREEKFVSFLLAPWELEIYPFFVKNLKDKIALFYTHNEILQKYYIKRGLKNVKIAPINSAVPLKIDKQKNQKNIVVCTSRITPSKRLDLIYNTIKKVPDFEFHFWGSANVETIKEEIIKNKGKYFWEYSEKDLKRIFKGVKYHIDMSTYKNDGDRPQLTTLEAMSKGIVPILRNQWKGTGKNSLKENENVLFADTSKEIANILINTDEKRYKKIVANNYKFIEKTNKPKEIMQRIIKETVKELKKR